MLLVCITSSFHVLVGQGNDRVEELHQPTKMKSRKC
jgi:hypothetical protein